MVDVLCIPFIQAAWFAAASFSLANTHNHICLLVQELKREGLVLSLPAADVTRKEVYYPVDQRIKMKVDADLQVR